MRPKARPPRGSNLDPYTEHVERRIAEGLENCRVLNREIRALGYQGSYSTVVQYVRPRRRCRQPEATMRFETRRESRRRWTGAVCPTLGQTGSAASGLDFTHFKQYERGSLRVADTARPGVPECLGQLRTVMAPSDIRCSCCVKSSWVFVMTLGWSPATWNWCARRTPRPSSSATSMPSSTWAVCPAGAFMTMPR